MNQLPAERRRLPRDTIKRADAAYHDTQFVKLTDPSGKRALWLRFGTLFSTNGFRRTAETWALLFERGENGDIRKTALKQSYDLKLAENAPEHFRIGDSEITPTSTHGIIQNKGRQLSWDLRTVNEQELRFNWVPEALTRAGLTRARNITLGADLRFSGTCTLDHETINFEAAPGVWGSFQSSSYAHSWVWGQCSSFVNDRGEPVPCIFEGHSIRTRMLGTIPSPKISTFLIVYQGKIYSLNTFWDSLRARSQHSFTEWTFQADHDELSFRGRIQAEHRDFAGVTYEDTDGSFLYGANAQLCNMTLSVYRRGKLEVTLRALGTASLEVCSRAQNPYVPLLI